MTHIDTRMLLPKGIQLSKTGTSFRVQTRKNVIRDQKKVTLKDFVAVKINYQPNMSDIERRKTFSAALEEAKKEKVLAITRLSQKGVGQRELKKVRAVGTLKPTYDALFTERWAEVTTGNDENIKYYAIDVFNYFPYDIRLDEMQTYEYYKGFIEHCKKAIVERKSNHMATYSTKTINVRLGLLRDIFRFAIARGLLQQEKLLNPDIRITNMGWENLPVIAKKRKMALSSEQEKMVLDKCNEMGDHDFADALVWLCDVGMRYKTEFLQFKIDDVNFKQNHVYFYRPKTNVWTKVPLTARAKEIAERLRDRANMSEDKRMFGHFRQRQIRTYFDKYRVWCGLPKEFTPYITRHTFMTKLGKQRVVPAVIAELGGVTIETAQKYYVHSNDDMLVEAIDGLNKTSPTNGKAAIGIGHNSRNRV
ncbi:integrase (XerC) [uncultured phage_Deep-GF0-KM16-C193]|uniref:Integrase n=1 Tax=uncultured phage_Deep-GF0-KM16-C193 TaxID=2740799 RepID=A0A1B1IWP1_9CAUD|nr:integrase (XerC) [uncultured phage_Deep-GF0-KM16-C193]ANS05760.1 integrase (XerC) [uncultured phage_Deep-GF0-KM16-C193]